MDGKLNCLEEWDYITGENRLRAYHFYDNILASSEIAKIAQDLGFDCKSCTNGNRGTANGVLWRRSNLISELSCKRQIFILKWGVKLQPIPENLGTKSS